MDSVRVDRKRGSCVCQSERQGARDDENAIAAAKAADGARRGAALAQSNKDALATYASAKAIGATGCYIG